MSCTSYSYTHNQAVDYSAAVQPVSKKVWYNILRTFARDSVPQHVHITDTYMNTSSSNAKISFRKSGWMSWRSIDPALSTAGCKLQSYFYCPRRSNSLVSGVPQNYDKNCFAGLQGGSMIADESIATLKMESAGDFIGEKLAPFNPSGDEVIRMAIEMLQVYQMAPEIANIHCAQ